MCQNVPCVSLISALWSVSVLNHLQIRRYALTHCIPLLGSNLGKKKSCKTILVLLFISIVGTSQYEGVLYHLKQYLSHLELWLPLIREGNYYVWSSAAILCFWSAYLYPWVVFALGCGGVSGSTGTLYKLLVLICVLLSLASLIIRTVSV